MDQDTINRALAAYTTEQMQDYDSWSRGDYSTYAGFTIKPKRDFGRYAHYINGQYIVHGWVAIENGCLALPAATWGQSMESTRAMVDVFLAADRDGQKFWHLLRAIQHLSKKAA